MFVLDTMFCRFMMDFLKINYLIQKEIVIVVNCTKLLCPFTCISQIVMPNIADIDSYLFSHFLPFGENILYDA